MTTSHRPQLEARSGGKSTSYVPTGTQHARLLPGHTKLKTRKGKHEEYQTSHKDQPNEWHPKEQQETRVEGVGAEEITLNTFEVAAEEGEEEEEEEEEMEESDNDEEALLQELNKIRQERMVIKVRKEQEVNDEVECNTFTKISPVPAPGGWRSNTTFGKNRVSKSSERQRNGTKPSSVEYINDLTNSEYHQDFLRRFVK